VLNRRLRGRKSTLSTGAGLDMRTLEDVAVLCFSQASHIFVLGEFMLSLQSYDNDLGSGNRFHC